jgi:hypothetical protein
MGKLSRALAPWGSIQPPLSEKATLTGFSRSSTTLS